MVVGGGDLGGWAIGVVDSGDNSSHRRSSGGGEDRRWATVGRGGGGTASNVDGRPMMSGAGGAAGVEEGEEAVDNSNSEAIVEGDGRTARLRGTPT
jgi:hypothetical protein